MNRTVRVLLVLLAMLAVVALLSACSTDTPAADEAAEQIESNTEAREELVDKALDAAQEKIGEAIDEAGGLEAQVTGLQIKSDLQQIQRELTRAIENSGDERIDAVKSAGSAFDDLIAQIEKAADNAPADGELQTKLNTLATKLRGVQSSLALWLESKGESLESLTTTSP